MDSALRQSRAPYLRLFSLKSEEQSLSIQQASEIWKAASVHNRHQLIAACLGYGWNVPWTADTFYVSNLLKQVEIFWHERFTATLGAVLRGLLGLPSETLIDDYRLVTLLTTAWDHIDDVCFSFVYAHPKGCAALQAYSAYANRLEVAQ